jgi:CheY-like chemotaxis protein
VIMLTANALDEHVQASLAAGADAHLSKPVRADSLLAAISAALEPAEVELAEAG